MQHFNEFMGNIYIYIYMHKKKVQIKCLLSYLELFSACKGKGLSP